MATSITRYPEFLPKALHQTHADELNGTADRGLFFFGGARKLDAIFCKAGASVTWTVSVLLPDGASPDVEHVLKTATGTTMSVVQEIIDLRLPPGTKVKVTSSSSAGANPTTSVISTAIRESNFSS